MGTNFSEKKGFKNLVTKFSGKKVLKIWGQNYREKKFGKFGDKIVKKKSL